MEKEHKCPLCGSSDTKKKGIRKGKQKYKCKSCGKWHSVALIEEKPKHSPVIPENAGWREMADWINKGKEIKESVDYKAKDCYTLDYSHLKHSMLIVPLADLHFGGWGTDYERLKVITEEILSDERIYITLDGDVLQNAVNMRNVKEVLSNAIAPDLQLQFLESWLDEVQHKVLWAGWGNHDTMREEKVLGYSPTARMLGKNRLIPMNSGIAHIDVKVGGEVYKIAASHFFLGRSYLNPTHSQARYMRFEGLDREIAISGHNHQAAMQQYFDGNMERLAINSGTLETNNGYSKRFFSLFTHPVFPCVELFPDLHQKTPYLSVAKWKRATA